MEYDFERLVVYQEAMYLSESVYRLTKNFPKDEVFGITSQIRRASLSVVLNIAEGKGRYHTKIFIQFLYQARGSLYEVIALINMANRLAYIDDKIKSELLIKINSIAIKLSNLINSMKG